MFKAWLQETLREEIFKTNSINKVLLINLFEKLLKCSHTSLMTARLYRKDCCLLEVSFVTDSTYWTKCHRCASLLKKCETK